MQRFGLRKDGKIVDQLHELPGRVAGARGYRVVVLDIAHHAQQGMAPRPGVFLDALQRLRAHAARGHIHNAQQRLVVCGVHQQTQIGDDILHFLAAIELDAAQYARLDALGHEGFFNHARLLVGAVHDGHAARLDAPLGHVFHHEARLMQTVVQLFEAHRRSLGVRGCQGLAETLGIVRHQPVCRIEDFLAATVIDLEPEHVRVGEVLREIQDVVDVRAAPGVDALVLVAHHKEVAVRFAQAPGNQVLRPVGVLILVDENVAVAPLVLFPGVGKILQDTHGQHQQVVKVHRVGLVQCVVIGMPEMAQRRLLRLQFLIQGRGRAHILLEAADVMQCRARRNLR